MPNSFFQIAVHLVFSTKNWKRFIKPEARQEMHSYVGGIINNLKGKTVIINGTSDHIHILCFVPKDITIPEFIAKIKANSSKWYSQKFDGRFGWQEGYAAFSVGMSNLYQVKNYILNQQEHHTLQSGMEEYEQMLQASGRLMASIRKDVSGEHDGG
jgi:REP element-mobilizing transposase RayT